MDSQKKDVDLSSSWVLLYFGVLGLVLVTVGSYTVCLHWRKNLQWERRAQQRMEVMSHATFSHSPLSYWINKWRSYSLNEAISIGAPAAVTKSEVNVQIPDSLGDLDTPQGSGYALRASTLRAEAHTTLVVSQQPPSNQMPQRQTRSPSPRPIFQEIPCAPPLCNLLPMLNHSATYPFLIYPERNVTSIPFPYWTMG